MLLFDSRWIGENGIGRFAQEIYNGLQLDSTQEYKNDYNPVSPFDPFRLSLDKKLQTCELFFSPGYNSPIFCKKPYILTVHDLNHIDRNENSSILKRLYYRTILNRLCHNAAAILTVSEFSKQRIIEFFSVQENKVFVVGNGVSHHFTVRSNKIVLDKPYIFCVSNRKGHKNEESLIHAFAKTKAGEEIKLVFSGNTTDYLTNLLRSLNIEKNVIFTGRLSDDELANYYRGALFSVFPSLYEGFGLPIVESFACGTAVITSNITSMPEIAGDAALLVNPHDIDEIARGIDKLFSDSNLRDILAKKGLERAKLYTWDNVVRNVKYAFSQLGYECLIEKK